MPLSDYTKSILKLRAIPLKRTRAIEERLDTALRQASAQIDDLIQKISQADSLDRRLYQARRGNLTAFLNELAINLKREIINAQNEISQQVAESREDATNQLLREQGLPILADFSQVPRLTLELLAQRLDTEGLKISAQVWAQNQIQVIETEILTAIARGTSAYEFSKRLRGYLLGSNALTKAELADLRTVKGFERRKLGHSILYKAKRLARSEINNAYWESGRLSAQESPVVLGIQWNLSNAHPKWDVCDILAKQNFYGLGNGVYPAEALPPKPHPNDLCYQQDVLRPVEEWNQPKTAHSLRNTEQILEVTGQGTKGHIRRQRTLAKEIVEGAHDSQRRQ